MSAIRQTVKNGRLWAFLNAKTTRRSGMILPLTNNALSFQLKLSIKLFVRATPKASKLFSRIRYQFDVQLFRLKYVIAKDHKCNQSAWMKEIFSADD
jgi:hypothetical protein